MLRISVLICLYIHIERSTAIGQMINAYLKQTVETNDKAIHLLFSANRWEARDGK